MCIDAAFKAVQANMACAEIGLDVADARLLIKCIRLNGECADMGVATGWMLSRGPHPDREKLKRQLEACVRVCQETAAECERLGPLYPHTKACATACKRCIAACLDALRVVCRRVDRR
jgi:hypothetical protein